MATEKEVKQNARKKAQLVKSERALVDNVVKAHLAVAKAIEAKDLKKQLVGTLTQLRSDIAEARAAAAPAT